MSEDTTSDKTPPAAAAVAAAPEKGDATIAETLLAIEQLNSVFGFDWEIAQQAVEAVGTDVTTAYNYILDQNLAEDQGGPVVPITDCPHVAHHVKLQPPQLPVAQDHQHCDYHKNAPHPQTAPTGNAKSDQDVETGMCPPGENWLCLECGVVRCSRYVNGHGLAHWEGTKKEEEEKAGSDEDGAGHCIAASLADLSVWCHACNAYLRHPHLDPLIQKLEQLKFGNETNEEEAITPADDDRTDVGRGVPLDIADDSMLEGIQETMPVEYPFGMLPSNLKEVADFILSDKCQSILVLAGAGMSVSSGIPDFRSAGGLYDTLRPELLTATEVEREAIRVDPTVALTQPLFLENPLPCLELKRPFLLGVRAEKWKATLAHRFVELLHVKTGKLTRLYTQNIDGLEGQCHGLPRDKVVAVHGSMDRAECALCGTTADFDKFCHDVQHQIKDITGEDPTAPAQSTVIPCDVCGYAAVKPGIVLFRSPLPEDFFQRVPEDLLDTDLLVVLGTSLTVAPANTLVFRVPNTALRVVVNNERVGRHLGIQHEEDPTNTRDYFARGSCDEVLLDLMCHLGWLDDLGPKVNDLPEESSKLLRDRLEQAKKSE